MTGNETKLAIIFGDYLTVPMRKLGVANKTLERERLKHNCLTYVVELSRLYISTQ